jgi:hypothetical protein
MVERQTFLGQRSLADASVLRVNGTSILESYERIRSVLQREVGPEAASIFARPEVHPAKGLEDDHVSWRSSLQGDVQRLDDLDEAEAARVSAVLTDRLTKISALLDHPEAGTLISAALHMPSRASILVVGDEPVLIDWGITPRSVTGRDAMKRHFATVLGAVAPNLPYPDLREQTQAAPPQHQPPPPADRRPGAASRTALWGCAIAAFILVIFSLPGVLQFQSSAVELSQSDAALMKSYEQRRAMLTEALNQSCPAARDQFGRHLLPPPPSSVIIGEGPVTGSGGAKQPPAQTPPQPPSAAPPSGPSPSPSGPPQSPASPANLAERIKQAVVLVVAGNSTGTGFFVTPELVVTNHHVVEGQPSVQLVSAMTGAIEAKVVSVARAGAMQDFALLRAPAQPRVSPLPLTLEAAPLDPVIAAGFPGLHLASDPVFEAIRRGSADAIAQLTPVYQTGVVNHLQRTANGSGGLVIHSAEIAPGNSGGPLVDYCGRVVGVNTFYTADRRSPIIARYALATDGLGAFLTAAGMNIPLARDRCSGAAQQNEGRSAQGQSAAPPSEGAKPPSGTQ